MFQGFLNGFKNGFCFTQFGKLFQISGPWFLSDLWAIRVFGLFKWMLLRVRVGLRVYVSIVSKEVNKNWGKNALYILKHEYSRLKIIDLMYFQNI